MSNNNTLPSSTVQRSLGSMLVDARVLVCPPSGPSPNMPLYHGRNDNPTEIPSNFQSYTDTMNLPATPVPYLRPFSGQPHDHSGVVGDAVFPAENAVQAGNNRPNEDWENIPPPVENAAAQDQPQNLAYVDIGYYDMANDLPPLNEHRDLAINNYAGADPHVPAQPHAAPPNPEIDIFVDPVPNAAADPARALFDGWPHQGPAGPVPNVEVNELLRQLAILYLYDPNSQIAVISMGPAPGQAHGVRVHISLDLH